MAISITLTTPLVTAPLVISEPGGTTITVLQGQEFVVSFRLEWNQADAGSYYAVSIDWWDNDNRANDNFTWVSSSAEFDNHDSIDATTDLYEGPEDGGTRYNIVVGNATGDARNGQFNVDLRFRASGVGGVNHLPTDNHPMHLGTISVWETSTLDYAPPDPIVTIEVIEWTQGVIVRGKANSYNIDGAGIAPFKDYSAGDNVPIIAAQRVDDGAVLVGGISSSSRNWRWNDTSPLNPDPHLDNLLDAAFQWMVPGATDVLWWEHPDVYNDTTQCSQLVDALEALGYTVVGDDRELADMHTGYTIDISGTISENLIASEDSYADQANPTVAGHSTYGENTSYDQIGNGGSHRESTNENCRTFAKWDLTELSAPTSISSATLLMPTYYEPDNDITVGIYEVSDDSWSEVTLNWNNMPALGTQIGTQDWMYQASTYWRSIDVTSYVQAEFANDNLLTIALKSENEDIIQTPYGRPGVEIESANNFYAQIKLEITYTGTIHEVYDYGLENMDILVINQLQRGTGASGGDPSLVTNTELSIIGSWVRNGGGLMITDGGDYGGYNYCLVQNKILDNLGVNWWLQHDQVYDDVDNWGASYEIVTDVDTGNPIGTYYEANTTGSPGKTTVGLYSCASLVAKPVNTSVSVSVAPALQSGAEDSDFTYTATITNTGPSNDRFWLSVSDSASPDWENLSVSPSYLDLASAGSDTATVTVSIPIGTPYCTYDTLTVTATSNLNPAVSGSGTAQAHSTGAAIELRGVTVEIEPSYQEAEMVIDYDAVKKRYDPLTFKVIVTNIGKLWDKYVLTATENSGDKILELWPTELFLQPGQSDFAVLSVTVAENVQGSSWNTITVEAKGTFATGTEDDNINAKAFDTCEVHIKEAYCVRLDVWPFQVQSATPGSKVRWIARVKNLGNVPNTYQITATNDVMDYNRTYDDALITVEPYIVELPPCNWAQVVIDLTVPDDLEMSTRIYVTVTVQSTIYEECYDEKEVEVHVVRGIAPIPQGVIKLEVETEIIAIQVWPTYYDFGVMDEAEIASTSAGYFTVRNIGNKPVDVTIAGTDAQSSPGELTTTWMLDDLGNIGLDRYAAWYDSSKLTKAGSLLVGNLHVSEEYTFDLTIQAPSAISVPSRMWTLVNLTAVEA